ncbi:homoserine O-succinyltransferase [Candidatus Saccharibacteria bacterium]|jgi:homoserine O-succinyltransferase|nr:homoserine O-succinyltransferase [Candidatus Saccharibacteria bacterium]MBP9132208.1 homoserine O-succinyltransferase [Candidatus Saccharibacteria bacterium]
MPIRLDKNLPAYKVLEDDGVFVMDVDRADTQDVRPIRIGILNLMPNKEDTEAQLLGMIGDTPLQIEPVLIRTESYTSKHVDPAHLDKFYVTFGNVKEQGLDGLIITGSPIELMEFEEVAYWKELEKIIDWAKENVASSLFLCWAAQACLYKYYKTPKYKLPEKLIGVFRHEVVTRDALTRGMDDEYWVPHGRNTETRLEDIENNPELELLVSSEVAGVHLVANKDRSMVFQFGHPEYLPDTLKNEYLRDKDKAEYKLNPPRNYFADNDDSNQPKVNWRANAAIFYRNWVNHVYQTTPFDLETGEFNSPKSD